MRPAREWRCPFTGEPADELHHPTGCDADGEYFDPDLVVPLLLDQHVTEHQVWDRTGIGESVRADSTWLRLRRVGQLLVRFAQFCRDGEVTLPSPFVRQLGLFMLRIATDVIEHKEDKQ